MRLLLDTPVFVWYVLDDPRLPDRWRDEIRSSANAVYLSVVSIWEACVKYHLGKLPFVGDPSLLFPALRAVHRIELTITEACLTHLASLPPVHRDPFDRMLICQAIEENCTLVTDDTMILQYPMLALSR